MMQAPLNWIHSTCCSFIWKGASTRRQRSDLYRLLVKLPPVTTSL